MNNHQKVSLELPSEDLLKKIGTAVVLCTQLEHLLKITDKRTSGGEITLKTIEKYNFSLGGLLNGASDWAETKKYNGLINKAKSNPKLEAIKDDLTKTADLVKIRNKYVHNGIAKDENGSFIFIRPKDRTSNGEQSMIDELDIFIKEIGGLMRSIHSKV